MNTQHFANDRSYRQNIVDSVLGGAGNVTLTNEVDRGHRNGAERFELTDNAVVYVYNVNTDNLITILFPRVGQLYSRFGEGKLNTLGRERLNAIKAKCRLHQEMGLNEL